MAFLERASGLRGPREQELAGEARARANQVSYSAEPSLRVATRVVHGRADTMSQGESRTATRVKRAGGVA